MKKNLDIILDNIVMLAEQFGFKEEIDKFTLMELLISDGYLTKDRKFVVIYYIEICMMILYLNLE